MIHTKLTWTEVRAATDIAIHRNIYDTSKQFSHKYGADYDFYTAFPDGIRSCIAEMAVAKAFGLYWTGVGGMGFTDVGENVEVRSVGKDHHGMFIHPPDNDTNIGVLAYVASPLDVYLKGWLPVGEAKKDEWWCEAQKGRPAFLVPNKFLRPMDQIWPHIKRRGVA